MPANDSPDSLLSSPAPSTVDLTPANDTAQPTAIDLSRVIVAATLGDKVALDVLAPAIRTLARASLVHVDDAERVTRHVLFLLGTKQLRAPAPSHATTFLDAVVRYYADAAFERTAGSEWEAFENELLVEPLDPDAGD